MNNKRQQPPVRLFEAPSIFEAYSKLKREMGENAVILSTKTITKGGVLGLWGQKVVQITASTSVRAPKRIKRDPPASNTPSFSRQQALQSIMKNIQGSNSESEQNTATLTEAPPQPAAPTPPASEESLENFKGELKQIRQMIAEIQESGRYRHWPSLPPEFQKAFEKLQSYNIHEDIARALIHRWKNHYPEYQSGLRVDLGLLESYISEMIVPGGPIHLREDGKPTVVMMVGPTGVGKTTSIAKLAAKYKIKLNKKVALITIDTYRIAAVEQLRTYSDLIGVPLKVVSNPGELSSTIEHYHDKDIILIDSAGRSPRNISKMNDLLSFVNICKPDELHLVLSISVHNDVMKDTIERFADFPVHKLTLTKLDEAVHYGVILSIISKTQKPIGYITTGQEVPDDIEVAKTSRLSRLILGREKIRE